MFQDYQERLQQTFRGSQVAEKHTTVVGAAAVEERSVEGPLQIVSPEDIIFWTIVKLAILLQCDWFVAIGEVYTYNGTSIAFDDDITHVCRFQGNTVQGVGGSI